MAALTSAAVTRMVENMKTATSANGRVGLSSRGDRLEAIWAWRFCEVCAVVSWRV